jgi:hypothetical protein
MNIHYRDLIGAEMVADDPAGCLWPDAGQFK